MTISPARTPKLPEGWTFRFTSRSMGEARIDLVDHRDRVVATEKFAGHAQSPEFLLASACTRVHAKWQATGKIVIEASHLFTASVSPEGDAWRVWCNQANYVNFLVDDPDEAPGRMLQALAQAKGLDPEDVRVTMVAPR